MACWRRPRRPSPYRTNGLATLQRLRSAICLRTTAAAIELSDISRNPGSRNQPHCCSRSRLIQSLRSARGSPRGLQVQPGLEHDERRQPVQHGGGCHGAGAPGRGGVSFTTAYCNFGPTTMTHGRTARHCASRPPSEPRGELQFMIGPITATAPGGAGLLCPGQRVGGPGPYAEALASCSRAPPSAVHGCSYDVARTNGGERIRQAFQRRLFRPCRQPPTARANIHSRFAAQWHHLLDQMVCSHSTRCRAWAKSIRWRWPSPGRPGPTRTAGTGRPGGQASDP